MLEGHNASGENNMNTAHKICVYSNTYTLQTTWLVIKDSSTEGTKHWWTHKPGKYNNYWLNLSVTHQLSGTCWEKKKKKREQAWVLRNISCTFPTGHLHLEFKHGIWFLCGLAEQSTLKDLEHNLLQDWLLEILSNCRILLVISPEWVYLSQAESMDKPNQISS